MYDIKPCPKCKKCSSGSGTRLVNLSSGIHWLCLWCEEPTPAESSSLNKSELNKIISESARKFSDSLCHSIRYESEGLLGVDEVEQFIDVFLEDYVNNLKN